MLDLVGLDHDDYAGSHELFSFKDEELGKFRFDDWQHGPVNQVTPLDHIDHMMSYGFKVILGNQELVWLHKFGRVGHIRECYKCFPFGVEDNPEQRQKDYSEMLHEIRKSLDDDISNKEILNRYKTSLEFEGYKFQDQEERVCREQHE